MSKTQVAVKANIKGEDGKTRETREAVVEFSFPEDVQEAIKKFGEKVALSKIIQQVTVDLQGALRRRLEKGQTQEQLQSYVENVNFENPEAPAKPWLPGVSVAKKSKTERLLGDFQKMSPEEQAAFLAQMKAQRAKS